MYCRFYEPDQIIIPYGQRFNEMYFIIKGGVSLYNKYMIHDFMFLPQYSFFGDYQILYDLKTNIVFKTASSPNDTFFMCVNKKVFLNLCELYPLTGENIRIRSLERRSHFMHHMAKLDSGPLKALKNIVKSNIKNSIRNKLGIELQSPGLSPKGFGDEEDPLEQFYSDEDPSGNRED